MSGESEKLRLKSIRIQNWKGFKDCKLELYDGLNVLVGPNSSGKTSLLEAFKFLKKALVQTESPYLPHLEWWTYRNIVYGNDETKPIRFELEFQLPEEHVATYEAVFTGAGGTVTLAKEELKIRDVISFVNEGGMLIIEHDEKFFERSKGLLGKSRKSKTVSIKQTASIPPNTSILSMSAIAEFPPSEQTGEVELASYLLHSLSYEKRLEWEMITVISPRLKSLGVPLTDYMFYNIRKFLNNILFIRHPDLVDIRQPQTYKNGDVISERGENLAAILHRLFLQGGGRLPDRIESALRNLFPYFTLRPDITVDGRVFLSIQDGMYGARLDPPSIPDGFYKLLHILTAVESKPSILLIDELENSLHSEILEYIVEELKNANITSIVATHSPIVVDVAGLECLQLLERTSEGNKVKRVENLEEIKKWMREKKLTPSEMWLYQLQ